MSSLTTQQHTRRLTGLGGTDAAAVLGISPWKTPLDVFMEKTGQVENTESPEWLQWRSRFEAPIIQGAAEKMGVKLRKRNIICVHPVHKWMIGYIDCKVVGQRAFLDAKTIGYGWDDWGEEGTDQIPQYYIAQMAHYMAILNMDVCYVAALFLLEGKLRIYVIRRKPKLEKLIIDAEHAFWHDHIIPNVPPEPTTLTDARKRWSQDDGGIVMADDDIAYAIQRIKKIKGVEKRLETAREAHELEVLNFMKPNSELTDDDGKTLATWRTQSNNRLDTTALREKHPALAKQFTLVRKSRVLRIK